MLRRQSTTQQSRTRKNHPRNQPDHESGNGQVASDVIVKEHRQR
jgi:hypothetical protein